jgi:hypothetical protein
MAGYRLFLFREGEIIGKVDRHCAEEAEILETARALCRRAYTVEIYQESRFIARIEHCD